MFIVYSKNGRNTDGVAESIAHAAGFSHILILDIGNGKNESNPISLILLNVSFNEVLPVPNAVIWAPAAANAPRPKPQGIWNTISVPGIWNLAKRVQRAKSSVAVLLRPSSSSSAIAIDIR